MTDTDKTNTPNSNDLALERTQLASVRTEFALVRTGFSIASFGAGVTELIGRNSWPDWSIDLVTSAFVLVGMVFVQIGFNRFNLSTKTLSMTSDIHGISIRVLRFSPWVLQIVLFFLLLLVLLY